MTKHNVGRFGQCFLRWSFCQTGLPNNYDIGEMGKNMSMIKTKTQSSLKSEKVDSESGSTYTQAQALYHAGLIPQAVKSCELILSEKPHHAETLHLLGLMAMGTGRFGSAVSLVGQAAKHDPSRSIYFSNLGAALSRVNRLPEALTAYQRALEIDSNDPLIYNNIGNVLLGLGRYIEAIASYRSALKINRNDNSLRINFCEAFWNIECATDNDSLKEDFLDCLRQKDIDCRNLTKAALSLLSHQPEIKKLKSVQNDKDTTGLETMAKSGELYRVLSDPLLITLMEQVIITDPVFEQLLTYARRSLLYDSAESDLLVQRWQDHKAFMCALAWQGSLNEFIWSINEQETELLDKLNDILTPADSTKTSGSEPLVCLYCCYRPIDSLVNLPEIQKHKTTETDSGRLLESLVTHTRTDMKVQDKIERLLPIKDDISLKVQNQYEESAFPLWHNINLPKPGKMPDFFAKLFPKLKLENGPNLISPEILVAGCGTGYSSIFIASMFENSRVLGVDLSLNALARAVGKAEELKVSNVKFMQADILDLRNLNRSFDIIESVGVLHHMKEPLVGWQTLTDILKPGGLMKIGLYSEIARRHIVTVRKFIADRGYGSTANDIRLFRSELMEFPESEMKASILATRDFYLFSECRDMLFHEKEHHFDLALVSDYVKRSGLRFVGFESVEASVRQQYQKRFPDDPDMISLKNWYHFEQELPDTFVGMYQFWLRKPPIDA